MWIFGWQFGAGEYYARAGFVSDFCAHHLEFVTRRRKDAAWRYFYEGESGGHGRPRCYAEPVDDRDLSRWDRHDGLVDHQTVSSKVVNYAVWKRDLFVVVIVNETGARGVLCRTDLTLTVADVLELIRTALSDRVLVPRRQTAHRSQFRERLIQPAQ